MKINKSSIAVSVVLGLALTAVAGTRGLRMNANAPVGAKADSAVTDTTVKKEVKIPENSVIDEVIWVVGDEPILKSDVEQMRMQGLAEGINFGADPDYSIPEQLAVQKLFLHQAQIDSIDVPEADVVQGVNQQINRWIEAAGSQEKLEEYRKQSINDMRNELHDEFKNQQLIQRMRQKLVEDIKVSPADVRAYFRNLPEDSIPYVPTEVEVEILVNAPRIKQSEINRVKDELRNFTDRVNKGETTFATLARLYSEDPGSARQGGELGYTGRGLLDPAFANVAFNLTDPKKISKIVESDFGYHIIQLIDKRGDKINCRHILLKPKVSPDEITDAEHRLDSITNDIKSGKFSFEQAATYLSDDKDTKNNQGLMSNSTADGMTSRFQMKDLPTEVARVVDTMKVGEISKPFEMVNNKGKTVVAVVKLKSRTPGHKATITEDFQVMKDVVLNKERENFLHQWVVDKIKHTYVRVADRYKNGKYEYQGWIK
ncbi:MAG: peptidylprolyl isomerase [Prevotella sp.]|jgi:peptidyl-prolyl cis-trans isomerase SurA|nr:peptidylprolyl isomerase [Prevotella sp.]